MAAGMVLGRFLRIKGLQKPIIAVTWLLLLFLGLETGSDREVIGALPSIGLASAALSIGGVAGSCILAWLLWKYMGGKVGEAVPEAGQGARETGAGGDLQAVSGLDMGTGRRISVWSGMGGSLVILGFFTLGIILGLAGLPAGQSIVHKLSFWSLCILMAMVGMSVGGNPELVSSIRSMNPRIALLPVATILGTYAGCIIVNLFLGHSIADVLAIGSGFGYYSLSSVLISSSRGPHLGSIALISNIIREVFTLLCAPVLDIFRRSDDGRHHPPHHFQLLWGQIRSDFNLSRICSGLHRTVSRDPVLLSGTVSFGLAQDSQQSSGVAGASPDGSHLPDNVKFLRGIEYLVNEIRRNPRENDEGGEGQNRKNGQCHGNDSECLPESRTAGRLIGIILNCLAIILNHKDFRQKLLADRLAVLTGMQGEVGISKRRSLRIRICFLNLYIKRRNNPEIVILLRSGCRRCGFRGGFLSRFFS